MDGYCCPDWWVSMVAHFLAPSGIDCRLRCSVPHSDATPASALDRFLATFEPLFPKYYSTPGSIIGAPLFFFIQIKEAAGDLLPLIATKETQDTYFPFVHHCAGGQLICGASPASSEEWTSPQHVKEVGVGEATYRTISIGALKVAVYLSRSEVSHWTM